jgi:hypothetical protein
MEKRRCASKLGKLTEVGPRGHPTPGCLNLQRLGAGYPWEQRVKCWHPQKSLLQVLRLEGWLGATASGAAEEAYQGV